MTDQPLLMEKADHVAVLTLNRPAKLNALDASLRDAMLAAIAEVQADDDVRAAIFTGAGRGFCSGADLTAGQGEAPPPSQNDHLDDLGWVEPAQTHRPATPEWPSCRSGGTRRGA